MTRNAGFLDYRSAEPPLRVFMGAEDEETKEAESTDKDDVVDTTDEDEADEVDNASTEEDKKQVRNRRVKQLSEEAKKHRLAARQHEERAEALNNENGELRIENAFIRASAGLIRDHDAAWRLVDLKDVSINDQDEVTGVEAALTNLIDRYPFVAEDDNDTRTDLGAALTSIQGASGRPMNGRRKSQVAQANRQMLRDKFPALRRLR